MVLYILMILSSLPVIIEFPFESNAIDVKSFKPLSITLIVSRLFTSHKKILFLLLAEMNFLSLLILIFNNSFLKPV